MEHLDYLDDESDFYGDKETQRRSLRKMKELDVHQYWANHAHLINVIAINKTVSDKVKEISSEGKTLNVIPINPKPKMAAVLDPYNPLARLGWAKQLGETSSEFLRRVPPLTTLTSDGWIWCANPYARRDRKPEDPDEAYLGRMRQLLSAYIEKKNKLAQQNPTMAPGTITRRLLSDRELLKEEIHEGAKKANMTCGKWMLFPTTEDMPRVWLQTVEAVSAGKLGVMAKVATECKPGSNDRLICIYTEDFTDAVDVRKQLETMADLHLVQRQGGRPIYYKADVYTYLDIYSDNPYGLKASQYSSKDIFAVPETKIKAAESKPQKRLVDGSSFKTRESPFKKR
ncbi:hypothetical protein FKW77_003125 [Venturia effusa]|uniref:DUF1917 domain-containing protein n=1 Tax=Venturia effusa TaxID=50376 RepID=A0A517LQW7_9PEZI|nr:hypothetical protein FKW77_003125 [Venturia effusa]